MNEKKFAEEIQKILSDQGLETDVREVKRNNKTLYGIMLKTDKNALPTVYADNYMNLSLEDAAMNVMEDLLNAPEIEFDVSIFNSPDYIKENVKLCIERPSQGTEYISRPSKIPGINEYMSVDVSHEKIGKGTFRVQKHLFDTTGLNEDELWETAKAHTAKKISIKTMEEVLKGLIPPEFLESLPPMDPPMYVVSTLDAKDGDKGGAAAILCDKEILDFAKEKGFNEFVMLPSSIYEVIIVPAKDKEHLEDMVNMVSEVNDGNVSPQDQLADTPYFMSIEGEEITFTPLAEYLEDKEQPDLE